MSRVHNDNVVSNFETNNVNDNEVKGMRKILNVNRIAGDLVRLFGSKGVTNPQDDKSWEFYCNAAGKLPETIIRQHIETAQKKAKSNPGGYFNRLCQVSLYKMRTNKQ